jgi:hypothetical protein
MAPGARVKRASLALKSALLPVHFRLLPECGETPFERLRDGFVRNNHGWRLASRRWVELFARPENLS